MRAITIRQPSRLNDLRDLLGIEIPAFVQLIRQREKLRLVIGQQLASPSIASVQNIGHLLRDPAIPSRSTVVDEQFPASPNWLIIRVVKSVATIKSFAAPATAPPVCRTLAARPASKVTMWFSNLSFVIKATG